MGGVGASRGHDIRQLLLQQQSLWNNWTPPSSINTVDIDVSSCVYLPPLDCVKAEINRLLDEWDIHLSPTSKSLAVPSVTEDDLLKQVPSLSVLEANVDNSFVSTGPPDDKDSLYVASNYITP